MSVGVEIPRSYTVVSGSTRSKAKESNTTSSLTMEREYTLSQIKWKRSLTDLDMKRRHAEKKERPCLRFEVIQQVASPTLRYELENFKLFGNLQKSKTCVHDTLPSSQTIEAERKYLEFERHRKIGPHDVAYNEFYKTMLPRPGRPPVPRQQSG